MKNSFLSSPINQWNNVDLDILNSGRIRFFKINKLIRPKPNSIYNGHNPKAIRLITMLRLCLSQLRKHKFKLSFQDFLNHLCSSGNDMETYSHFLHHCPTYSNERMTLLNKINGILEISDTIMTKTLLFGDGPLVDSTSTLMLNSTNDHVIATKGFDDPILT